MQQSAVQWTNGGVWPVPARSAELITPICQATMALTMPSLSNTHLFQTRVFPMATVSHQKTFLHYIVPVTCENQHAFSRNSHANHVVSLHTKVHVALSITHTLTNTHLLTLIHIREHSANGVIAGRPRRSRPIVVLYGVKALDLSSIQTLSVASFQPLACWAPQQIYLKLYNLKQNVKFSAIFRQNCSNSYQMTVLLCVIMIFKWV